MKYVKQSRNACLAYSLLQIGAVKRKHVAEYEEIVRYGGPSWRFVGEWLCEHAPNVAAVLWRHAGAAPQGDLKKIPNGCGVCLIEHAIGNHALSFKDGKLMDPAIDAPGKAESLSELRKRYRKSMGDDIRVLAAIEVN